MLGASAFASVSETQIREAFIGHGLHGWIQSSDETESPSILRHCRFHFDGEAYRLTIAGMKPIRFGLNRLWTARTADPNGPGTDVTLQWEDSVVRVTLLFRSDQSLARSVTGSFNGKVSSIPRVIMSVLRKQDHQMIGHGAMLSLDQEERVLNEVLAYFKPLGQKVVSFEVARDQTCAALVDRSRIRVRE